MDMADYCLNVESFWTNVSALWAVKHQLCLFTELVRAGSTFQFEVLLKFITIKILTTLNLFTPLNALCGCLEGFMIEEWKCNSSKALRLLFSPKQNPKHSNHLQLCILKKLLCWYLLFYLLFFTSLLSLLLGTSHSKIDEECPPFDKEDFNFFSAMPCSWLLFSFNA